MATHLSGFILGLLAVLVATLFTLYRYGNLRKQHVVVTLATLVAWYFSFIIVFILPLDVSATSYRQCKAECQQPTLSPTTTTTTAAAPDTTQQSNITVSSLHDISQRSADHCGCVEPWTNLPEFVLPMFWKVVYWSAQILTWLVLPLMQSYANAGEFTVLGKLRSAVIANLIYYGTYAVIFCICLIYVATRDISINAENLKVIGITASNTWGLFLLVLLYGYGLVDIPRTVWYSSHTQYTLNQTYFRIAKLSMECSETQEKYEDVLEDVRRAAEVVKYNHAYRKYIDTIVSKCPEDFSKSLRRNDDYVDYNDQETTLPTEKALIKMHINVINSVRNYNRTQSQKVTLVQEALDLEDDLANLSSSNKYYKRSTGGYEGYLKLIHSPRLEWWWRCLFRPYLLKLFAVILAIFSVMVVWSECVFFVASPVLSLFAIFIKLGKNYYAYTSTELISILVLAYLCVCAYRTVFRIRVFNYYYIAANHQTDENSLLFSGMLLSRLTPPLCLNFLSLIQLDSHVTHQNNLEETSYTHIMGHMDVISIIANGFNIYFPIAILLLCIATVLRLGSRLLHCIGFEQFIDDDMTQDIVDEGRNLVQREKLQSDRDRSRVQRRTDWDNTINSSRIGNNSTAAGIATSNNSNREWNNYESINPSPNNMDRRDVYDDKSSSRGGKVQRSRDDSGGRRSARSDDRTELLSDQDVVEYNPDNIRETDPDKYNYNSSRPKPNSRIFDDM